jgi:hypothetical protein
LVIDLKPALDEGKLNDRILRDLEMYQNRAMENALTDLLPRSMIPVVLRRLDIDPAMQANSLKKQQRRALVELLKAFTVEISGATPIKSMALVPIFDTACFEFVSAEWLVDAFMLDIEDNTLRSIAVWTSETDVNMTVYRITLRAKVMTDHASVDFTAMLENESGIVVTSVVDKAVDVIECPHNEKTYVGIDDSYNAHVCVTCGYTDNMVEHDFDDCNTCTVCGYVVYMVGDVDGDGQINSYDTVYLLYHIFFEDSGEYPITQPCDFNGDGVTDSDDAVYLLYYIFFGEVDYPLHDAR